IALPFKADEPDTSPDATTGVGVPLNEIYGFRTPYLETKDAAISVVKELGLWYDCSLDEGFQFDQDGTNYLWPYTLDSGSPGHDLVWEWVDVTGQVMAHSWLWELPV